MLKTVSSVANALGALNYKGTWDASTNTPALASGVGTKGDYYVVSVDGATDLDGITNWGVGDWATFNGSVWQRVEGGADGNFVNLDVTGTATMGGLTVDGDAEISSGSPTLYLMESDTTDTNWRARVVAGDLYLGRANDAKANTGYSALFDANGDISFYEDTGTTPKFFWDASAESLGVGTSSPASLMHLSSASPVLSFTDTNSFTDVNDRFIVRAATDRGAIQWYDDSLSTTSELMTFFDSAVVVNENGVDADFRVESDANTHALFVDGGNNRLGINTSSPSFDVDIQGANPQVNIEATTDNWSALRITSGATQANYMFFFDDTAERARITVLNNEEINFSTASSPVERLSLSATKAVFNDTGVNTDFRVESDANANMLFVDGGNNAVGIGTSSPAKTLEVNAGTNTEMRIGTTTNGSLQLGHFSNGSFIGTDSGTPAGADLVRFGTGGIERARLTSDGDLLVGTTSTVNGGHVLKIANGTVSTVETNATTNTNMIVFRNGNGNVGNINTDGSATSFNTSSDQRLKENITDADDAGSKIDAIQVRKFDWKVDGSHQDYGMVAQELQAVAPEAVSAPEDPEEMMGVDYSKLVPMLIKEIQSLRARVAQLES